jgi:F-type H+-transporting ATPase subunit delta
MKGSLYSTEIADPYAQALMSVAQSANLTEQFGEEMRSLLALLESSRELKEFISNPIIADESKKAVLGQIVGENANPYLVNFLMLLVEKRRILFLAEICQQYLALLRKLNNTVLAEVTSAKELTAEQQQAITDKAKAISGAQAVELKVTIDPNLIGGVIIKVGSQVYDASLRGQLRRIGYNLSGL